MVSPALLRARRLAATLALGVAAASGCASYEEIPLTTVVTCGSAGDCPSGRVCSGGRCVLPSSLGLPPDLVGGRVTVVPQSGTVGTTFTVEVHATKELDSPPRVILGVEPLVQLPCTRADDTRYTCVYTATGAENGGLGGTPSLDVRLVDRVGQESVKNGVGTLVLDFAPPALAARSVQPGSIPLGGVLQIFITTDEDVGAAPVLVASRALDEPGGGVRLTPTRQPGTRNWTFTHVITPADGEGPVDFTVDLVDAVGNGTTAVPVGRVVVDPIAPSISALAVSPARLRADGTLTVTFDVSEPAAPGSLSVMVGANPMTCGAYADTSPRYTCTRAVLGTEIPTGTEAAQTIVATLTDAAGNRSTRSTSVLFDFRPPAVAEATVAYTAPDASYLPTVARAKAGTRVTVAVLADEALGGSGGSPTLLASAGGSSLWFTYLPAGSTATSALFEAIVPAGLPDGDYLPVITWGDLAGNRTTTGAGLPPVKVKTSTPALVVAQDQLVWVRSPLGNGQPESLGAYTVPAGPYFAVEPADPLSSAATLPAGSLSLAGGGRLAAVVVQTGQDAGALVLGKVIPDALGRFPRKQLASVDVAAAWLVGVDDAANVTSAVKLTSAEWVATTRPPDFGASPHALTWTPAGTAVPLGAYEGFTALGPASAGADSDAVLATAALAWERRTVGGVPEARYSCAGAYDARRGRFVIFGGSRWNKPIAGDTWEWDGAAWHDVTPPDVSPAARTDHAMVYDSLRGRVVLFGGSSLGNDLWEWDGASWKDVTPPGPGPGARSGHAMAFDAARGRLVLFGGHTWSPAQNVNDTWEWDGASWTSLTPARSPSARVDAAMAYDPNRQRVLLFSGELAPADTWEWDGTTWTTVTPAGGSPSARSSARMVFDANRNRIMMFGGETGMSVYSQEAWEWTGSAWNPLAQGATIPTARSGQAMAFDARRGETIMFGGLPGGTALGDTWRWSGAGWKDVTSNGLFPPQRYNMAVAQDTGRGRTVVFGGTSTSGRLADTWEWDGVVWRHPVPASSPQARDTVTMAYDASRGVSVLFGGVDSSLTYRNDVWEWNGTTWSNPAPGTRPAARAYTPVAYAWNGTPVRRRVTVFGGYGPGTISADLWEWDGLSWTTVTPVSSPPVRRDHGLAYDASRGQLVLFGGYASTYLPDLWEYDGALWHVRTPTGSAPDARTQPAMTYDSSRARTVLYGGIGDGTGQDAYRRDLWEWNGTAWRDVTPPGLSPGPGGVVVYDPARLRAVHYDGSQLWELPSEPSRRPAVQFDVSANGAGFAAGQVTAVRTRACAGGTSLLGGPGAEVVAWSAYAGSDGPGWLTLGSNTVGLAASAPWLPAPATSRIDTSTSSALQATRLITDRDGMLSLQVRPRGGASTDAKGAAVALDYLEVRVRYAAP